MPRHAQEGLPLLPTGGLFVGAETDKVGESPTAAVVALPPGADDDVLTVVEGAPAWAAPSSPSGGSGPLTIGPAPPAHVFTSDDLAGPGTYWGDGASVYFFTWTPERSGTVTLQPPGVPANPESGWYREYDVWAGTVAGVDYPGRDLATSGHHGVLSDGAVRRSNGNHETDDLTVVGGTTYTVALTSYQDSTGADASVLEFFQSVQILGGVDPLVPFPDSISRALAADGELYLPDGPPQAGAATGEDSYAEKNATAAAPYSHAEGSGTVALGGDYGHAEGQDTLVQALWGHAQGDGCIVEEYNGDAMGGYSRAVGANAIHAHAASKRNVAGDAQYCRAPYQPRLIPETLTPAWQHSRIIRLHGEAIAREDTGADSSVWEFDALLEIDGAGAATDLIAATVTNVHATAGAPWTLALVNGTFTVALGGDTRDVWWMPVLKWVELG